MKKKMNKIRKTLLLCLLAVTMMIPCQAFADYSCTVSVPVEVKVEGSDAPSGNEYRIILEAADQNAPLPEVTEVVITDSGKSAFGSITFTKPEDYHYRVYQTAQNREHFTNDTTVYNMTVRVVNDEKTGGLRAEIWATKGEETDKVYELLFTNQYHKPYYPPASEPEPDQPEAVEETPLAGVLGAILPQLPQGVLGANRVKTGDSAPVAALIAMVAAAGIVIFAVFRKKREDETKEA